MLKTIAQAVQDIVNYLSDLPLIPPKASLLGKINLAYFNQPELSIIESEDFTH